MGAIEKIITAIFLLFLLNSCNGPPMQTFLPTYTDLPTYTPYPTFTVIIPTPSSTNTYLPSVTWTPTITRTPTVTWTRAITPTITMTPTITSTPTKTVVPSPTAKLSEPWHMCPESLIFGLHKDFTQVLCYTIDSEWNAYGFIWYSGSRVIGIGIVLPGYCPSSVEDKAINFVKEAATIYGWTLQDMQRALDDIYSIPLNQWSTYNSVQYNFYITTTGNSLIVFYRAP